MTNQTLILGIESSCDETAASVLRGEREVLSDVVASQTKLHSEYGGVVPELACRAHTEAISIVVDKALNDAGVTLNDISAIAVTQGPGLVGALLIGLSFAKSISFSTGVPIVPVNHLEAHILAANLEEEVRPPFVGLVVSGGHTAIYLCQQPGKFRLLGQTVDDAAGEAFDKVAKIMGLGYPGGVVIDKLAKEGDATRFKFPRPLMDKPNFDFSFSGLKTALKLHIEKYIQGLEGQELNDTCASFQAAVVETLLTKTLRAARDYQAKTLVVCGGVACNSALRDAFKVGAARKNMHLVIPRPRYCTDNAVMVASAGRRLFLDGVRGGLDINAIPTWPLEQL